MLVALSVHPETELSSIRGEVEEGEGAKVWSKCASVSAANDSNRGCRLIMFPMEPAPVTLIKCREEVTSTASWLASTCLDKRQKHVMIQLKLNDPSA